MGFIFIGSDLILYHSFKVSLNDNINNTLTTAAEEVEKIISRAPQKKWREYISGVERGFLVNRLFIQLVEIPVRREENPQLIARSGFLSDNFPLKVLWESIAYHLPRKPQFLDINLDSPSAHPMRLLLYPVQKGRDRAYLIQVGSSLLKIIHTLKNFLYILMISGPILLFISVQGGYFILSRALRPVRMVVQTARQITAEDLSLRIDSKNRRDEIGLLITTFNQMISRLEKSVKHIKQFSSDASHDLKTPLTVIRGEVEITLRKDRDIDEYKKILHSVWEEAQKMERVIDNLMMLSLIDVRDESSLLLPIQLDEILLEVYEKMGLLAREKNIALVIGEMEPTPIMGDSILLNRMVTNLLDNAIKYTPNNGKIELFLENTPGKAIMTLRDTGIGIPQNSLPFIFDRFYRVDSARSSNIQGSGLGLSIVKKIAEIHQADIKVDSHLNIGTTVQVIFPQNHFQNAF